MKTLNCLALLCLSAAMFSCNKENATQDPKIKPDKNSLATTITETYSQTSTFSVAYNLGFYAGDVNGDGSTDVIQLYNNNGLLGIYVHNIINNGAPVQLLNQSSGLNNAGTVAIGYVAGDFDGDGKADLIQCWNWNGHMTLNLLRSTGTSFVNTQEIVTSKPASTIGVYPVDVDGDGKTDVAQLLDNGGRLRIIVYRSNGATFSEYSDLTMNQGSGTVGNFSADVNGDGVTELVQCWNDGGKLAYIVYHVVGGGYEQYFANTTTQGAGNTGLIPIDYYGGSGSQSMVQAWNENGRTSFFLYSIAWSPNAVHIDYSLPQYFTTNQGAGNLAWLSVKRPGGDNALLQIWNNNGLVAFFKYKPAL